MPPTASAQFFNLTPVTFATTCSCHSGYLGPSSRNLHAPFIQRSTHAQCPLLFPSLVVMLLQYWPGTRFKMAPSLPYSGLHRSLVCPSFLTDAAVCVESRSKITPSFLSQCSRHALVFLAAASCLLSAPLVATRACTPRSNRCSRRGLNFLLRRAGSAPQPGHGGAEPRSPLIRGTGCWRAVAAPRFQEPGR